MSDDSILAERARLLARRPDGKEAATLEAVEFELADGLYAVETVHVGEVLPLKRFSPLPSLPPFVLGIMNVRGRIWSVLDTRVLLGLPAERMRDDPRVILLASPSMEFGLLVDRIRGACRLPLSEMTTPAGALCLGRTDYVRAVTSGGVVVLDAARMLSDPALVVRQAPEA